MTSSPRPEASRSASSGVTPSTTATTDARPSLLRWLSCASDAAEPFWTNTTSTSRAPAGGADQPPRRLTAPGRYGQRGRPGAAHVLVHHQRGIELLGQLSQLAGRIASG